MLLIATVWLVIWQMCRGWEVRVMKINLCVMYDVFILHFYNFKWIMFSRKRLKSPCFPLLTKKTIQPLRTQLWTFAKMAFNCWPAVAAALAPHIGICRVAVGTAVVSLVKMDVRDAASRRALDMMTDKTLKMPTVPASCTICAAWLFTFSKSEYAEDKVFIAEVAQLRMSITVEMAEKLYTVTDMKQDP